MKKEFKLFSIGFGFILLMILVYGCTTTGTRVAMRTPPPSPPPKQKAPAQPAHPPKPKSVKSAPAPVTTPPPKSPVKVKKPAKPPITYVIIKAPVGILGTSKIDLLESPNPKSRVVSKIESGTRLELLTTQGTWMKVKTRRGRIGWISTSYLSK